MKVTDTKNLISINLHLNFSIYDQVEKEAISGLTVIGLIASTSPGSRLVGQSVSQRGIEALYVSMFAHIVSKHVVVYTHA